MYGSTRVFIVGCARSGTTLLQRMLNAHSQIAVASETHFIRRFWLQQEKYGDIGVDANYAQLIEDIVHMPESIEMKLNVEEFRDRAWTLPRSYEGLLQQLLVQYATQHRARVAGEKTPNHVIFMQELQRMLPKSKFIHIIRDPRAVVNSWRTVPWSTGTLEGDARIWRYYLRRARKRAPRRGTLLAVYYEHLVCNPRRELARICDFLGVSYEPTMLNYHQHTELSVNLEREPWKAKVQQPVAPTIAQRWRNELSDEMIRSIEAITWPEMVRYGYKPVTPRAQLLATTVPAKLRLYFDLLNAHLKRRVAHL